MELQNRTKGDRTEPRHQTKSIFSNWFYFGLSFITFCNCFSFNKENWSSDPIFHFPLSFVVGATSSGWHKRSSRITLVRCIGNRLVLALWNAMWEFVGQGRVTCRVRLRDFCGRTLMHSRRSFGGVMSICDAEIHELWKAWRIYIFLMLSSRQIQEKWLKVWTNLRISLLWKWKPISLSRS